jgi:tryptophan 2,3-dioxygenase
LATGEKTLTLKSFEEKYGNELKALISKFRKKNLWKKYLYLAEKDEELTRLMKELDEKANVYWPLAHYKSAVKYLQKNPMDIAATGGTNWQKFLPPRFQKVIFYPELWSDEEIRDWGKKWVEIEVLGGMEK